MTIGFEQIKKERKKKQLCAERIIKIGEGNCSCEIWFMGGKGKGKNDFPACEVKIFVAFSAGVTDGSISRVEPSHGLLIPCRTSTHIGSSAVTGSRPKPAFFFSCRDICIIC